MFYQGVYLLGGIFVRVIWYSIHIKGITTIFELPFIQVNFYIIANSLVISLVS